MSGIQCKIFLKEKFVDLEIQPFAAGFSHVFPSNRMIATDKLLRIKHERTSAKFLINLDKNDLKVHRTGRINWPINQKVASG